MEKFNILEQSREIYFKINNEIIPLLNNSELFSIGSQLSRCSLSIVLNIREGNSYKDKRKNNLFNVAIGSCNETEECIYLLSKKYNQIDYEFYKDKLSHIKFVLLKINTRDSSVESRES